MLRIRLRRALAHCAVVGALMLAAPGARAAVVPYEGIGQAPAAVQGKGTGKGQLAPRRHALLRAREAALLEGLGSIDVPVDEAARKTVLGQVEVWTSAYRIIEEKDDGATITVKVEVELDLARLRKRVAKPDPGHPSGGGFRVVDVDGTGGCSGLDGDGLVDTLHALGVATSAATAPTLRIFVTCRELGAVPYTHMFASRAELVASGPRGELARVASPGFAPAAVGATDVALQHALAHLAEALAPAVRGGVELRVEKAWPATRVARLERGLRDAVMGVTGVELVGLEADGTVRLHVQGNVDPEQLTRGLRALELPGFALDGFRVDSPHVLTVRVVE